MENHATYCLGAGFCPAFTCSTVSTTAVTIMAANSTRSGFAPNGRRTNRFVLRAALSIALVVVAVFRATVSVTVAAPLGKGVHNLIPRCFVVHCSIDQEPPEEQEDKKQ